MAKSAGRASERERANTSGKARREPRPSRERTQASLAARENVPALTGPLWGMCWAHMPDFKRGRETIRRGIEYSKEKYRKEPN